METKNFTSGNRNTMTKWNSQSSKDPETIKQNTEMIDMCRCENCRAKRKRRVKAVGLTASVLAAVYLIVRRTK